MTKEEINYSTIQALRFEFDSQLTSKLRLIEIAKTVKKLGNVEAFEEMVSDLKIDGIINSAQADELLKG